MILYSFTALQNLDSFKRFYSTSLSCSLASSRYGPADAVGFLCFVLVLPYVVDALPEKASRFAATRITEVRDMRLLDRMGLCFGEVIPYILELAAFPVQSVSRANPETAVLNDTTFIYRLVR